MLSRLETIAGGRVPLHRKRLSARKPGAQSDEVAFETLGLSFLSSTLRTSTSAAAVLSLLLPESFPSSNTTYYAHTVDHHFLERL